MLNHAITGYTCFFMCHSLRKNLFQFIRALRSQLIFSKSSKPPATLELQLTTIISSRF